jgi:hypothetical protein
MLVIQVLQNSWGVGWGHCWRWYMNMIMAAAVMAVLSSWPSLQYHQHTLSRSNRVVQTVLCRRYGLMACKIFLGSTKEKKSPSRVWNQTKQTTRHKFRWYHPCLEIMIHVPTPTIKFAFKRSNLCLNLFSHHAGWKGLGNMPRLFFR